MTPNERDCLRGLAARVAEIAALPEQAEKRQAVMALNRARRRHAARRRPQDLAGVGIEKIRADMKQHTKGMN